MNCTFILAEDGKTPVHEPDTLKWAKWYETAKRHIAQDRIGEVRVSTVFLGLDHRFGSDGPPILWETMICGGPLDGEQQRYCSYEDALQGHAEMLALVALEKEFS